MLAIVAAVLFLIALVFELASLGFGSLSALVSSQLDYYALHCSSPGSVVPTSRRGSHTPDACPGEARWSQDPRSSSEIALPASFRPAAGPTIDPTSRSIRCTSPAGAAMPWPASATPMRSQSSPTPSPILTRPSSAPKPHSAST